MICPNCHHEHGDLGYKICERCREQHREANRRYREKHDKNTIPPGHPIWDGREYAEDEVEFMLAMEKYKIYKHRPFPTWHEVLEVAKSLGYRKVTDGLEGKREAGRGCARGRPLETTCRDASQE